MNPSRLIHFLAISIPLMVSGAEFPFGKYKSFGRDGGVITRVGERGSTCRDLVVQGNGKVISGGQAVIGDESVIALVRRKSNGTLDHSFGTFGQVLTRLEAGSTATTALALQADGRIVVAAHPYNQARTEGFIALRYLPNGALDHTFGNGGLVAVALSDSTASTNCLALQTDGKILLGGQVAIGGRWVFGLLRLTASGTVDSTFGAGGSVLTDFAVGDAVPNSIAIQTDGKIVLGGSSVNGTNSDFAIARYHLNGDLDSSFGVGGVVTEVVGNFFDSTTTCLELDSAGRILLGGWSTPSLSADTNMDLTISRLLPSGQPDLAFGDNGVSMIDAGQEQEAASDIALEPDGKILVTSNANGDFSLIRLLLNGDVDGTFGRSGLWQLDFGGDIDDASAIELGMDGDIFVGGYATLDNMPHFALWRVQPSRCR